MLIADFVAVDNVTVQQGFPNGIQIFDSFIPGRQLIQLRQTTVKHKFVKDLFYVLTFRLTGGIKFEERKRKDFYLNTSPPKPRVNIF